jgi:hypothetical protein
VTVNAGASVYHIERTLGAADNKQVLSFPFDVGPGCERLEITLRYAPERVGGIDNLLVPALFDPFGCRGTCPHSRLGTLFQPIAIHCRLVSRLDVRHVSAILVLSSGGICLSTRLLLFVEHL